MRRLERRFAKTAVVLALCALPGVQLDRSATATVVLGSEILVSAGEDFAHVETMLAANPANPLHLLASSIVLPKDTRGEFQTRSRGYLSRDAGRTWSATLRPDENLWDPVVAFTERGTALFVALLPPKSLSVFRSADGGSTWNERTDLPFVDGAMIAIDRTRGKHRGRIYLAGRKGEERTDPIVVLRSDDDGRTFDMSVAVEQPLAGRAFNPLVLADGTLFVPYTTLAGRRVRDIQGLRSSDGGRTLSQAFHVATRQENSKDPGDTPPAVFAAGFHAGKERLYTVYTAYRPNTNARLMLSRSDDGGRTWTEPKDVTAALASDLTVGSANISINRDGIVGISWLQRKIGEPPQGDKECERFACFNETDDLFFIASRDGGDTWSLPARISTSSSNPRSKHASRFFPGQDYMLTDTSSDGTFHLFWPDARSGIFQLYARPVRVE